MKKIVIVVICSFLFISCKTINIPEKWAFMESKYNFDKANTYIQKSNVENSEKEYKSKIISDVIKSDKVGIISNDTIKVNRSFFQANDSIRLEYFEFEPKSYNKTGVFFVGNGSSVLNTFKELQEFSVASNSKIYVLNYRGYGKSDGKPSFKTVFLDNKSFVNYLEKSDVKINFAMGYSLGSVSATYLAVDNKIDNLILLAPFSNSKEIFTVLKRKQTKGIKSIFRPFIKLTAEDYLLNISNTAKIKNYSGNLLISQAKDDETLPYKMGKGLYENCTSSKKELITIEKGGHVAPFEKENWSKIIQRVK